MAAVSNSFACLYESLQVITKAPVPLWESRKRVSATDAPLYESLGLVSSAPVVPWESKGRITKTHLPIYENLEGVSGSFVILWVALGLMTRVATIPWEVAGPPIPTIIDIRNPTMRTPEGTNPRLRHWSD